jgi:lysozyme
MKAMKTSHAFENIIVLFEGLKTKAYRDSKGIPTIGIGTIRYPNGKKVAMGDVCTESQAYEYLHHHLGKMLGTINGLLVNVDVNQHQFDAITSLVYNIGVGGFAASQTLKEIKKDPNNFESIKVEWLGWCKETNNGVKEVSKGLLNRRKKEWQLYTTPID